MYLAHLPSAAGRDNPAWSPAQIGRLPGTDPIRADPRQLILGHTLLITTAGSEDHLVRRTLTAACEVTGGAVAAAITPDGLGRTHGCPTLVARIEAADPATLRTFSGGHAAGLDLPPAVTATLDEILILVAAPDGGALVPDAGTLLALVVAHAQATRNRLREIAALSRRAEVDPLTGLGHLGPFAERLDHVAPTRTAVIVLDLDDFKKINDEYGHKAGDQALLTLVAALRSGLRGDDRLFRIGGDEFAVVVDVNGPAEVVAIARRLLDAARRAGQPISVGAAIHAPGETGRQTLERADRALYEAKRSGRNTARLAA